MGLSLSCWNWLLQRGMHNMENRGGDIIDISFARIGDNSDAGIREYIQLRRQIWAKNLSPQVKLIALAIIEHMSAGRLSCYPSKARLLAMVNMTERAFDAHYRDVKNLFIIEIRKGKASIFHARIEAVTNELLAMWPRNEFQPEPPAESAPPQILPPAESAYTPPAESAGGSGRTPRNLCTQPPAESAPRRVLEEIDNKLEEAKKEEKAKRACQLQPRWMPSDATVEWAKGEKIGATPDQIADQFEAFRDYHLSKGSKFVDWDKAFQTWMRNAKQYRKLDAANQKKRSDYSFSGNYTGNLL